MIRLIIDKLGTGHDDLFLKIDSMPSYSKTSDSYYLAHFLELDYNDSESLRRASIDLINYWIDLIKELENGQSQFLPFDLWDEYIGGLLIQKTKFGFKTKIVFTDMIHGYEVSKSTIDMLIKDKAIDFIFEENAEWVISEKAFLEGLDWSINEIKK